MLEPIFFDQRENGHKDVVQQTSAGYKVDCVYLLIVGRSDFDEFILKSPLHVFPFIGDHTVRFFGNFCIEVFLFAAEFLLLPNDGTGAGIKCMELFIIFALNVQDRGLCLLSRGLFLFLELLVLRL